MTFLSCSCLHKDTGSPLSLSTGPPDASLCWSPDSCLIFNLPCSLIFSQRLIYMIGQLQLHIFKTSG